MTDTRALAARLADIQKFAALHARQMSEQAFGDSRVEQAARDLEDVSLMLQELPSLDALVADVRQSKIPREALRDAVGLVSSEARKWEGHDAKTHEHWEAVYTALAGCLLAEDVRADVRQAQPEATPMELDNHHNAALCPYCRPTLEQERAERQAQGEEIATLRQERDALAERLPRIEAQIETWVDRLADATALTEFAGAQEAKAKDRVAALTAVLRKLRLRAERLRAEHDWQDPVLWREIDAMLREGQ